MHECWRIDESDETDLIVFSDTVITQIALHVEHSMACETQ